MRRSTAFMIVTALRWTPSTASRHRKKDPRTMPGSPRSRTATVTAETVIVVARLRIGYSFSKRNPRPRIVEM